MEVSGQLHAPAAVPQGKSPHYLLDRRLGGPQSRSGHGGEEKNFQPRRESNPKAPIVQLRIIYIQNFGVYNKNYKSIRGCIQKFPDWVDNEITRTKINTRWEAA
jgi:hypothetical protein